MPYVLGVNLGDTRTTAAVCRVPGRSGPDSGPDSGSWTAPEPVELDGTRTWMGSELHLSLDGTALAGHATTHRDTEPSRNVPNVLRRTGDPVPVIVAGQAYQAEVLAAALAGWVADHVADRYGGYPERIVVNHPPGWGSYRRRLLSQALDAAGLPGVLLAPTPVALAHNRHATDPVPAGGTLVTCRMGGAHVEAACLRRTETDFELLHYTEPAHDLAGGAIDDLLTTHVLTRSEVPASSDVPAGSEEPARDSPVAGSPVSDYPAPDSPDPASLRAACRHAKERLSTDDQARIPLVAGNVPGEIVLTRNELEQLAYPVLDAATAQLRHTVTHVPPDQPVTIVLTGGTASVPLAARLASTTLERHGINAAVRVDPDPGTAACRGAALIARNAVLLARSTAAAGSASRHPAAEPMSGTQPHRAPELVTRASGHPVPEGRSTTTDRTITTDRTTDSSTTNTGTTDTGGALSTLRADPDTAVGPPPPRPPVHITPLEPPRRFGKLRRDARGTGRTANGEDETGEEQTGRDGTGRSGGRGEGRR